jgi:peptidoglycan/LPS O-acetylase OafA/YrhL
VDTTSAPNVPARARQPGEAFHIPSLDGIRAVSFFVVFFGHAGLGKFVPGYFGLSLFFFLSGYLITTLLRLEYEGTGTVSLRQFYLRRVLRIFPPFYLVLFVAMALTALGLTGGTLWASACTWQMLHLTNYWIVRHGWWWGMAPGTWVYWSLAVEEHFYLFFPLVYRAMCRRNWTRERQSLVLLVGCGLVLAWRYILIYLLHADHDRCYVSSDTRVDSIVAGCILAIWKNPVLDKDAYDDKKLVFAWLPLGVVAVLVSLVVREPHFDQTLRYSLQSFGLLPFFVVAIRFPERLPFRWLNSRLARFLGGLSYSMYLMHTSLLWCLERWTHWPTAVRSSVAVAILVGAGTLIFRYIEKPCARLRRRLSTYLSPAARETAPS